MRPSNRLALLVLSLLAQVANSLRMINLDAPQVALQGDTIHLSCLFKLSSASSSTTTGKEHQQKQATGQTTSHLAAGVSTAPSGARQASHILDEEEATNGDELLYAIKWYKDGKEFYRFLGQEWPKKQALPVDGVQLDLDKSDNHTVVLQAVGLRASGLYKCEVSTDAPLFITKSIERRLLVYALPNKGPSIQMIKPRELTIHRGDSVELLCQTPESKPPLSLDWIINDTLNLSSAQSSDKSRSYFNYSTSRFVRLPSLMLTALPTTTTSAGGGRSSASKQAVRTMAPQILYLIQNGSMASPLVEEANAELKPQAINLAGSLDRLPETSTARLNFTADGNLFLYLKQPLPLRQSSPPSLSSSPSRTAANLTRPKGPRRRPSPSSGPPSVVATTGSTLRIKCIGRVLHLTMSDEIRLNLIADKDRKEARTITEEVVVAKSGSSQRSISVLSIWLWITVFGMLLWMV